MKKELINEIEELNWEMDLNRRIKNLVKSAQLKAEIKESKKIKENPPVILSRQLKRNSKGSMTVIITVKNALTGKVLEKYSAGSLKAMISKIESYREKYPSVEVKDDSKIVHAILRGLLY